MQDRGVFVDYSTVHRWAIKMVPVLTAVFLRRKRAVGRSWRMDETSYGGSVRIFVFEARGVGLIHAVVRLWLTCWPFKAKGTLST